MKINSNLSFLRKEVERKKIIALQGGTRSGKTYSALQFLIEVCCEYTGLTISVVRATLPALKATAMRDFFEIIQAEGYYQESEHNKTESSYNLNGNLIEFVSLDQPQKVRGRKRHLLFCNECNEIDLESWRQLLFRTSGKVIIDYNPSEPEHWIYDEVLPREDCAMLITTYKDNPHLPKTLVEEIELYQTKDPDYWRVFGEGQRGASRQGQIFTHFQKCDSLPVGRYFYGLDFGKSNDPTALVKCFYDGKLYCDELIYQTNLTASEIAKLMKQNGVSQQDYIYADSAEPLMIRELVASGFNVVAARKGAGSISGGIDKLKSMDVLITNRSANLHRESQWYQWQIGKDGKATNEPKDLHNHLIDSLRYSIEHITSKAPRSRPIAAGARIDWG